MASNADNGEHPYVSQEGVMVPSRAFVERFDVSRLGVAATNATVDTPVVAAAADRYSVVDATQATADEEDEDNGETIARCYNSDSSDDDDEHPGGPRVLFKDSQQQEPAKKSRKKRYAFSKKKLYATPALFLHSSAAEDCQLNDTELMEGQIVQCPNEKNGKLFVVKWVHPFPVGINPDMLRTQFHSDNDTRELLESACQRFLNTRTAGIANSNDDPSPESAVDAVITTTPAPSRRAQQASAAMRSSVTIRSQNSVSDISSRSSSRRGTRSSEALESDSDDEQYDLNESENLWHELPAPLDTRDSDSETEEIEEAKSRTGSFIGDLLSDITWGFEEVDDATAAGIKDEAAPPLYDGPSGLKRTVLQRVKDPFDAVSLCGLDYEFVAVLAANSNEYVRNVLLPKKADKNGRFLGMQWRNITTKEMYRFLGILLKISLSPIDGGGYEAYFKSENKFICGVEIQNTCGFAIRYMSITRFKQIRAALHPENSVYAMGGDKCYQLRSTLRQINQCALQVFEVGPELTFDEGGIACRSRFCPVRQYNKDKPQKFRVDMFIMADASSYHIYNVDVYQGKNASNIDIHPSIETLPTTQKAVLNAVISMGLAEKCTDGARHVTMDNRYQCPELAFTLRQKFRVYSTGTCRVNRKGWDKSFFDLTKKNDDRGTYKRAYDKRNMLQCVQWVDSKSVQFVSSLTNNWSVGTVRRQVGSTSKVIPCPSVVKHYQETMFGVDKGDQFRARGGGFANKAHFKKWYKKIFLGCLDLMLMNAYVCFNMVVEHHRIMGDLSIGKLQHHEILTYIAERLLNFEEDNAPPTPEAVREKKRAKDNVRGSEHQPIPADNSMKQNKARCTVCRLETYLNPDDVSEAGLKRNLVKCACCFVTAHNHVVQDDGMRKIHGFQCFKGMTCFDILHTEEGRALWKRTYKTDEPTHLTRDHRIYRSLRSVHGKSAKIKRKRRSIASSTDVDNDDNREEKDEE